MAVPEPSSKSCRWVLRGEALASRASNPVRRLRMWQSGLVTGAVLDRQLELLKTRLAGRLPISELPTTGHARGEQSFRAPTCSESFLENAASRSSSQSTGVATLFMRARGVSRSSPSLHRTDDSIVGSFVANRNRVEIEKLIGLLRQHARPPKRRVRDPPSSNCSPELRDDARGLRAPGSPFRQARLAGSSRRDPSRHPIFSDDVHPPECAARHLELPETRARSSCLETGTSIFDLPCACDSPGTSRLSSMRPTCTTARRSSDS